MERPNGKTRSRAMGRITQRSSTHLTDWQIADAFPDECKKYCRLKFAVAKAMLQEFLWNIERICEDYPDDFERNFFVDINWMFMPKRYRKMYQRNEKILAIVQMKKKLNKEGKPELNIELAKSRPIEELYSFEKMRTNRKHLTALCPFHDEKTPSFTIYREKNRFVCFSCNAYGDSIDFVMKLKNIGFMESVKFLLE